MNTAVFTNHIAQTDQMASDRLKNARHLSANKERRVYVSESQFQRAKALYDAAVTLRDLNTADVIESAKVVMDIAVEMAGNRYEQLYK